jgi:hypothetical protein
MTSDEVNFLVYRYLQESGKTIILKGMLVLTMSFEFVNIKISNNVLPFSVAILHGN